MTNQTYKQKESERAFTLLVVLTENTRDFIVATKDVASEKVFNKQLFPKLLEGSFCNAMVAYNARRV